MKGGGNKAWLSPATVYMYAPVAQHNGAVDTAPVAYARDKLPPVVSPSKFPAELQFPPPKKGPETPSQSLISLFLVSSRIRLSSVFAHSFLSVSKFAGHSTAQAGQFTMAPAWQGGQLLLRPLGRVPVLLTRSTTASRHTVTRPRPWLRPGGGSCCAGSRRAWGPSLTPSGAASFSTQASRRRGM